MTSKLSYEEIRRMARVWFADAHKTSEGDEAEVAAWREEHRKHDPSCYIRKYPYGIGLTFRDRLLLLAFFAAVATAIVISVTMISFT